MLIIKPYGRSLVKQEKKAEQRKREIRPTTNEETPAPAAAQPIADFIKSHDEAVIAQWISVIDKIIAKPSDKKEPEKSDENYEKKKKQYELSQLAKKLREILGDAAWKKLEQKNLLQKLEGTPEEKAKIQKRWKWKIAATQSKPFKSIQGRWYRVFVGDLECNKENIKRNAKKIAEKIYSHLYEKAYRFSIAPDKDKVQEAASYQSETAGKIWPRYHKKGLIEHRVHAIEKNVLKPAGESVSYNDEKTYIEKAGDIADGIRKAILAEWGKKQADPETQSAEEKTFKDRPYEIAAGFLREARIKVFDSPEAFAAAKENKSPLFNLHSQIREAYKSLLKGHKKLDQKLEKILPEDMKALFHLIEARKKNKEINHLIRLGKIIHYEASFKSKKETTDDGRDKVAVIITFWPSENEVLGSSFWSSEGQTEIKQNEAFVRVWRGALAFAARTLKDWADPENKIPGDILMERKEAIARFNVAEFDKKYKVLFGDNLEKYMPQLIEKIKEGLLEFSLKSIYNLRNTAFHFKGMKPFIDTLNKVETNEIVLCIPENIYKTDYKNYQTIQKKVMGGACFHEYFSGDEIEKIWQALTSAKPSLLPLPKLKRVLQRAEDAWKGESKLQLPAYSKAEEREASKWARCQYTATKLLYDGPFKNWLEEQQQKAISDYIKQALEHTQQAARTMNGKGKDKEHVELITAKAAHINLKDWKNFQDFCSKLMADTATEMRVQNFYQSDGEAAKQQAEYIEKFKCDVVALAFAEYLKIVIENIEEFCAKEQSEKYQENFAYVSLQSKPIGVFEPWQAKLYFLLHLMPVEEVGSLRNQLKKWEIVTGKSHGKDVREKDLLIKSLGVFDLYIGMHDAQFVDAELKALSELPQKEDIKTAKAFFESESAFDKIFLTNEEGSKTEYPPIRGLREMQRFGRGILHSVYENEKHKITHKEVAHWQELKETIDDEQKRLKALHEEWITSKHKKIKFSKEKREEYKFSLKKVEEYRHLTAQVKLQNHVHLHRLLMMILGRLLDFSGLWERDLYFILLALFHKNKVSSVKGQFRDKDNEILDDKHGVDFLKEGRIVEAFIKLKDAKLRSEITNLLNINGIDISCKKLEMENKTFTEKCNIMKEKNKILKEKDPLIWLRNRFAHLAMLEENNLPINLTEEINNARQLMAYDRKFKNAVAKSIIDLLKRENIELKWSMGTDHKLQKVLCLCSEKAYHLSQKKLKGKFCHRKPAEHQQKHLESNKIEEELCNPHFIAMVTSLFTGNGQDSECCASETSDVKKTISKET